MILKTVNRFLNLNSSFWHACMWKSATARHWSLLVAESTVEGFQILVSNHRNLTVLLRFR
jgi:hypothetical protein